MTHSNFRYAGQMMALITECQGYRIWRDSLAMALILADSHD